MLHLPQAVTPVSILPVGGLSDASLLVFDGQPDDQDWLGEALRQARVCGTPQSTEVLELLSQEPLGAPYGPDFSRSARVARVTGVVAGERDGQQCLEGFAVAHGCCYAYWDRSEEGDILVMEFQMPTSFGSGAGKDSLAQEHLMVRCLRLYEAQAESLLAGVDGAECAHGISVAFVGEWDESTGLIQRRLAKTCVALWAGLQAPAADLQMAA